MIYCGSGSGKVLIPVSVQDPDLISTVFQKQILNQNLVFSLLEAALFPRMLASIVLFFYFCISVYFILNLGPKSVPNWNLTVSVPLRQKVAVPFPASVPQHCIKVSR